MLEDRQVGLVDSKEDHKLKRVQIRVQGNDSVSSGLHSLLTAGRADNVLCRHIGANKSQTLALWSGVCSSSTERGMVHT